MCECDKKKTDVPENCKHDTLADRLGEWRASFHSQKADASDKNTFGGPAHPVTKDRDLMFECLVHADEICFGTPDDTLAFAKKIYEWVK